MLLRRALQAFETEFFARLAREGYGGFRPKHGAVFVTIDMEGSRITDLAARAGMSNPAMLELVDEMERLGYLFRTQHPGDRRAKIIRPTPRFLRLLELAAAVIRGIETEYRRRVGKRNYEALRSALTALAGSIDRTRWGTVWHAGRRAAGIPSSAGPDVGLLLLLALRSFERKSFDRLKEAGYTLDRRRHLLVLNLLGTAESRATGLAARIGISKPAVGKVLEELEARKYIAREADAGDRRATAITLTPRGIELLRHSSAVFQSVERWETRGLSRGDSRAMRTALVKMAGREESAA